VLARGEAGSIEAGTWVVITACIRDERVERLDARVYGCPHTMAASDRVVQLLTGGTAAGLGTVDPLALGAALEIPVEKSGRLLIIQDALRNCLADWDNAGWITGGAGGNNSRECPEAGTRIHAVTHRQAANSGPAVASSAPAAWPRLRISRTGDG
jgi:hypothetical protein